MVYFVNPSASPLVNVSLLTKNYWRSLPCSFQLKQRWFTLQEGNERWNIFLVWKQGSCQQMTQHFQGNKFDLLRKSTKFYTRPSPSLPNHNKKTSHI
jgi:hypothetical protein